MAYGAVERDEEAAAGRHQYYECPTRFQGLSQSPRCCGWVCDVFKYVNAQDRVERVLEILKIDGAFWIQLAHTNVRRPQESIAQRVQIERVLFTRNVKQAAAHETRRDVADARTGLKYRVTQERPQHARQ